MTKRFDCVRFNRSQLNDVCRQSGDSTLAITLFYMLKLYNYTLRFWMACLVVTLSHRAAVRASVIYQGVGNSFIAFEAEATLAITNAPPTQWVITNEPAAGGGAALYADGVNQTASAASFAEYALVFTTPGTYSIYYRWRADKTFTDRDPNSANSFRLPVDLGDLPNDPTSTNFVTASVNNAISVPAANAYNVFEDSLKFTVTAEEIEAGSPLIFKIGTREAGMFIDRFLLSTNASLTEADFNALPNSDTDLVTQGGTEDFVAFQAERVAAIAPGTPTSWTITNDPTAIASKAIYQQGVNQTATPASFATYSLKFTQPGTYSIYYRWRADKTFTDRDPNSANSFRLPVDFGDLPGDTTSSNYVTASVNNQVAVPAANLYNVFEDSKTYTVSPAQASAGIPLVFKIGTREAGMFIDRFVFSLNSALSEGDFNALPDSGAKTVPRILTATGSAAFTTVKLSFDKPLMATSADPQHFGMNRGVTVIGATLDTLTSRDIYLTTSPQLPGTNYVVTINGVTDVTGGVIAPNTTISFTAWTLSPGWVTREFYLNVDTNQAGGGVADLLADAKFPDSPNSQDIAYGFRINYDPSGNNYGARVRAFFIPPVTGNYTFYAYNDAAVTLNLSSDDSSANLAFLLDSPLVQNVFDASVSGTTDRLVAGKKYLLEALFRQETGSALMGVAAELTSDPTPPDQLPVLGGNLVSTWVNPDAGVIQIAAEPADTTAPAGGHASFTVAATTPHPPLYYQWQVNGVDIPNANRAKYTTPVLLDTDTGKTYGVIVRAAGASKASRAASLTVGPSVASTYQPYIGVNFVTSSANGVGGVNGGALFPNDVTGVVAQGNFNNVGVTTATDLPLIDGNGAETPVTLNYTSLNLVTTGAGNDDAEHALFQSYLHNGNNFGIPMTLTLNNVPAGLYSLILYSVGFNFNATYEQDVDVAGGGSYPTLHVQAQDANQYGTSPGFRRMTSTDPDHRGPVGNYVQFDQVTPAADSSIAFSLTPQSTNTGSGYLPPLNAFQLVKTVALPATLVLAKPTLGPNGLTLGWTGGTGPFLVQYKVGLTGQWLDLVTTANHTITIPTVLGSAFYRIWDGTSKTVSLFRAKLTPQQEVQSPPVQSANATGTGFLSLAGDVATYYVDVTGLSADAIAAHLHGPAAAGANAAVLFHLVPSPNIPAKTRAILFAGSQTLTAAQKTALTTGQTYFNVHTTAYPGGEIRGQVLP